MSNIDLPNEIGVYRALRSKGWKNNPKKAFYNRESETEGISVFRDDMCRPCNIATITGLTLHGVFHLPVPQVRAVRRGDGTHLKCQNPDTGVDTEGHSYIIGLPFVPEDYPQSGYPDEDAEHCADQLVQIITSLPPEEWNP